VVEQRKRFDTTPEPEIYRKATPSLIAVNKFQRAVEERQRGARRPSLSTDAVASSHRTGSLCVVDCGVAEPCDDRVHDPAIDRSGDLLFVSLRI
jgi:hypothetical protein